MPSDRACLGCLVHTTSSISPFHPIHPPARRSPSFLFSPPPALSTATALLPDGRMVGFNLLYLWGEGACPGVVLRFRAAYVPAPRVLLRAATHRARSACVLRAYRCARATRALPAHLFARACCVTRGRAQRIWRDVAWWWAWWWWWIIGRTARAFSAGSGQFAISSFGSDQVVRANSTYLPTTSTYPYYYRHHLPSYPYFYLPPALLCASAFLRATFHSPTLRHCSRFNLFTRTFVQHHIFAGARARARASFATRTLYRVPTGLCPGPFRASPTPH